MMKKSFLTKAAAFSLAAVLALGFSGNVSASTFKRQVRGEHGMWVEEYNGRWKYSLDDGRWLSSVWVKDNGDYYYFYDDGYMASFDWIYVGAESSWYFVDRSGKMLRNTTTPDGYYVKDNGAWDGRYPQK